MGKANVYGMVTIRNRLAQTAERLARKKHYFKLQAIDGSWMVSTSANLMDVVKSNLTESEADAWVRLLQEGD